jgi:hypothetical protein
VKANQFHSPTKTMPCLLHFSSLHRNQELHLVNWSLFIQTKHDFKFHLDAFAVAIPFLQNALPPLSMHLLTSNEACLLSLSSCISPLGNPFRAHIPFPPNYHKAHVHLSHHADHTVSGNYLLTCLLLP